MAMTIASQAAKRGAKVEDFLPKFSYTEVWEADELTFEQQKERAIRVATEITKQCRGHVKKGPLLTLSFKPGELRRIKHDGDGSESGG